MGTAFTPIPLGLDDFVQGGLVSDVPVEILQIQFRGFDYGGKVQKEVLSIWMQLALLDENLKRTTDEPIENFWSAGGDLDEVAISDDGYMVGVLQNGSKTAMTKGSNFEVLMQSFTKPINGGPAMPKNFIRDNGSSIKCLLGTKFHMLRTPAPKREGIDTSGRARRDTEQTIATCTKVYWAPWSPKAAAGKVQRQAAAATASAAAAPASSPVNGSPAPETVAAAVASGTGDEMTSLALDTVRKALESEPVFETTTALKVACFRLLSKTKAETRNTIVKLVESSDWLKANGITVRDDGVVVA